MEFKIKDIKGSIDIVIKIGECTLKAIKWICITLAYLGTVIAISVGLKRRKDGAK
jgi:hypothetical protein